jgi:glucosamine--fructose-6-phosphate aminotransferase (isomerizing)
MCGIVGGIAERDIVPVLIKGLQRLEYRGYDSAGMAILNVKHEIQRLRTVGKVSALAERLASSPIQGTIGIAHTRWATHGVPNEINAHPHIAADRIVLVHNGIVENYQTLKTSLLSSGFKMVSETDSEVVAYAIAAKIKQGKAILPAVQETVRELTGAYALCVMDALDPTRLIGVRSGPPLVIGIGVDGHFLASDTLALQGVAQKFIYLEEGDLAEITGKSYRIFDKAGNLVERKIYENAFQEDAVDKGHYPHYMLKEIYEQPRAIRDTLQGKSSQNQVLEHTFGARATEIFDKVSRVQIIACGTSYNAGMIGRMWLEAIAKVPCQAEIASEFRYRQRVAEPGTLLVCISQSGETADTLAALRSIEREKYCGTLAICNVPNSSLVRETDLVFLTNAGPEIGVCSTKAFTTQLIALFLFSMAVGRRFGLAKEEEQRYLEQLNTLPDMIANSLSFAWKIEALAKRFAHKAHTLFLGRGLQFPIALEGALKLKEISYIHAEAYPAGELKHGPLALVDKEMLIVVTAPNDALIDKLKSNIQEVRSRGGELFVFTPIASGIAATEGIEVIAMPEVLEVFSPILYTVPLQLLAYYVAVLKGTDVDQPRNLAKSVTVE